MIYIRSIVELALSQQGDQYVWGSETNFEDQNPDRFDCSELCQWACQHAAWDVGDLSSLVYQMPDGSWIQEAWCRDHDTLVSVPVGISTFGALLFRIGVHGNHVAISLGNGKTIEARGRAYGVNTFNATGRTWTSAGLIPGAVYTDIPPVRPAPQSEDDEDMARKMVFPDAPLEKGRLKGKVPTLLTDGDPPVSVRQLTKEEVALYRGQGVVGPVQVPRRWVEWLHLVDRQEDARR